MNLELDDTERAAP